MQKQNKPIFGIYACLRIKFKGIAILGPYLTQIWVPISELTGL